MCSSDLINAFIAIGLGAFGAHGLKTILSESALQTWQTAVDYHGFHALGLILIGILAPTIPAVLRSGWWMVTGIILFSGSLYLLSLTDIKILGAITPFGGGCFLISWMIVAWYSFKVDQPPKTL